MKARDIMVHPVHVIQQEATLADAAQTMLQHNVGCLPVVNTSGQLCGILTEGDFVGRETGVPFAFIRAPQIFGQWLPQNGVEHLYAAARSHRVRDHMSTPVITVTEEQPLAEVIALMIRHDIKRLPVVRNNIPVGIISRHDLLKLMMHNPLPRQNNTPATPEQP